METKGSVFLDTNFNTAVVNGTPLVIAQRCGHTDLVKFLEPAETAAAGAGQKRQRSQLPLAERAACVGVAHRLKPIPPELDAAIRNGSAEEQAAAKKTKQRLQSDNQKIVVRAEEAQLKQQKLPFAVR